MLINIFLIALSIILLGALVFSSWVVWGFFQYGAPLVPTSQKVTERMIALANIQSGDRVYDLGCGTGTILFGVVKRSPRDIKCIGYDLVRPAIWFAKMKIFFVETRHGASLQFECRDFFTVDVSDADVIFCYLLPEVMQKIYTEKWETLKSGCKIISHGFPIHTLQPTHEASVGKEKIYVYEKRSS
jgi:SAM-dependent methyltransferase